MEGNESRSLAEEGIQVLLNELEAFKKQNAELCQKLQQVVDENCQLKQVVADLQYQIAGDSDGIFQASADSSRRRKFPKTSEEVAHGDSAAGSLLTTPGVNVGEFVPVVSKKNNGKKKIIQTLDADLSSVRNAIKNANCANFTMKQSNKKAPIKITVDNQDDIVPVRNALIDNKISFHEFKSADEKFLAFVIRGLTGATEDDLPTIFEELVEAGIPNDAKLSLLVTGFMKANPSMLHNSLLKLVVPPNFDTAVLKKIKFIDHVAVKFEKLQSKTVVQCKNCQRFGHSAGGCRHAHRCVKCGENHLKNDCPRTYNKAVKLFCCNCSGEHSANNLRDCSFFIKNFKKPEPAVSVNMNVNNNFKLPSWSSVGRSVSKPNSYAAVTAGTSGNNNARKQIGANNADFNLVDVMSKLDRIMQLVTRHDTVLQKLCANG